MRPGSEQGFDLVRLIAALGLGFELIAGQQPAAQRLPHGHRELLGLETPADIEQCSRWRGQRQAIAPYGVDLFTIGAGVKDDTRGNAQPAATTRNDHMHGVGDTVAEVQQCESTLVGDQRVGKAEGHPGLADLVVLVRREPLDAVEPAPYPLKASPAYVMLKELATDSMSTRLAGVEVAALLVGLGLQAQHIRPMDVLHKTSIALLSRKRERRLVCLSRAACPRLSRVGRSTIARMRSTPLLIEARPLDAYEVHVRFEDGTTADVDLSYLLEYGGVFEPLRDPAYFVQLRADVEAGTIVWPNDADIAPDTLYARAQQRATATA